MFFVGRALSQISRTPFRNSIRLYCNANKKFKEQSKSTLGNEFNAGGEENSNKQNFKFNEEEEEKKKSDEAHNGKSDYQETEQKNLMVRGNFEHISNKNRETYLSMVKMFVERDVHRRNHVEFIYAALKHMKEFGVHTDLEVYKALIDIMPKGKFIPTNMFQAEFSHYPKQQECITYLLDQMEHNGVMPDFEMEDMLLNIFGKYGHAVVKFWRMMYWMPKFKYLSPWLLPNPVPNEPLELAKLAVRQMCTIDVQSVVEVLETKNVEGAIDDTWIVSGQSPDQRKLLDRHAKDTTLQVQGPFLIWLRNRSINYYTLVGDAEPDHLFEDEEDKDDVRDLPMPNFLKFLAPEKKSLKVIKPKRSIHQQDDGTIYAICATGTSTKDSLLSWIRLLERNGNSNLANTPVLFKFKSPVNEKALVVAEKNE